jgi:hypothetical protein
MRKAAGSRWRFALLVGICALAGSGAGASSASAVSLDCAVGNTSPCINYCYVNPDGGGSKYPCSLGRVPNFTSGTYSFNATLSAAEQDATGVPGDPGASGTSNITVNAATNQLCATTTWTGIDSKVVAGHIHGGQAGKPENPAITIDLFPADFVNGKSSGASGCTTVPPGSPWVMNQCPAQFSLVVHSFNNPVGAIRGQLGTTCVP